MRIGYVANMYQRHLFFFVLILGNGYEYITCMQEDGTNLMILTISKKSYDCRNVTATDNSRSSTFARAVIFCDRYSSGFKLIDKYGNVMILSAVIN
jgi:hypothetical protein